MSGEKSHQQLIGTPLTNDDNTGTLRREEAVHELAHVPDAAPRLVVRVQDGLGNQMFQYAYGYATARKLRLWPEFDLSYYRVPRPFRRYGLNDFRGLARAANSPQELLFRPCVVPGEINAANQDRLAAGQLPQGTAILAGYWQDRRYPEALGGALREAFVLRNGFSPEAAVAAETIRSTPNVVAVHVRCGDYLKFPEIGICSHGYTLRAMNRMKELVPDASFFVFSDDIAWCRKTLGGSGVSATFVSGLWKETEELHLMALCRHHVIPNSTYSWWAAWLAQWEGQKVVCPDRWLADPVENAKQMRGLISPEWHRIAVQDPVDGGADRVSVAACSAQGIPLDLQFPPSSPLPYAPFNADIHLPPLILFLRDRFSLKIAVETGSFGFQTTTWLTEHFNAVFTFEANLECHLNGRRLFIERLSAGFGRAAPLVPLLGSSEQLLPTFAKCLTDQTLFYLDAHTCPQHTAIRGELTAIHAAGLRPVIVVHDFQNPLHPEFGFDRYDDGTVLNVELVKPYLDLIYGVDGYQYGFNREATGARRGILWVAPKQAPVQR